MTRTLSKTVSGTILNREEETNLNHLDMNEKYI